MNKTILTLSGKADQTFKFFDAICKEYGKLTLGDLAKRCYKTNCWILWEANK